MRPLSYGLAVHTLCTGVQEAMAEILALQDFLYYVIGIHPGSIDSLQLILHGVLLYWMSAEERETAWSITLCASKEMI